MDEITEKERIIRDLQDAGCSDGMIQKYLQMQMDGRRQDQYRLLSMHRATLLNQIHDDQQMIDCLDYLIYTLKKGQISSQ